MNRGKCSVEWARDGDVHVATAKQSAQRRFRIEQRTVFVLCEEKAADAHRSFMFNGGVPLRGETWTKNGEELAVADTREEADTVMRAITERGPLW